LSGDPNEAFGLSKDQEYSNVLKGCEYVTLSKHLTQSCYIYKFTVVEDKLTMQGNSSLKKQPQITGDSPSFSLSHGQQAI
jgi:hypothetical protein